MLCMGDVHRKAGVRSLGDDASRAFNQLLITSRPHVYSIFCLASSTLNRALNRTFY